MHLETISQHALWVSVIPGGIREGLEDGVLLC